MFQASEFVEKFKRLDIVNQCALLTFMVVFLADAPLTADDWRAVTRLYHEGRSIDAARFDRTLDVCWSFAFEDDNPTGGSQYVPAATLPGSRPMLALAPCKL